MCPFCIATFVIDNIQAVSPQPSAQKVNPSNANNKDEEFQEFRPPLSPDIANMLQRMKLCYLATKLGTKPHGRPLQLAAPCSAVAAANRLTNFE